MIRPLSFRLIVAAQLTNDTAFVVYLTKIIMHVMAPVPTNKQLGPRRSNDHHA